METFLIATDLSNMKQPVLDAGFGLARKTGANVCLTVIINKNLDYFPPDTGLIFSDQWQARQYLAERQLEEIRAANSDLEIEINACIGDPQKDIIELAIEKKASMIVIGTHGRGGLYNSLLGGTAQYVVRHSPVPILVVPFNKTRH